MDKKRVLFIGEASFLATGFSTYWNEVIRRIHATGEFEIAELGSYACDSDPRCRSLPWKFYPTMPDQRDQEAFRIYQSNVTHQFGEGRFNQVCLDFKPDIVYALRDWWMDEFVLRSPFRKNFKFIWMPTVDGAPQRNQWMDDYSRVDVLLTYSEFGKKLLIDQSKGKLHVTAVASPGADLNVFKPVPDKNKHKAALGINPDSFIVGTVMRNQNRKLYYDLIEAFAQWCKQTASRGHGKLVEKTFLYLHTSYPDVGYDIGRAVHEFGLTNKVYMSYLCNNCGLTFPSFFSGEWIACKGCKQIAAHPPNTIQYCSREVLAAIMNLFDLYVQYSICEGWGMPITDAKACGIPTACVDYSAMEDHAHSPGGIPIKVQRFFYEGVTQTEQRRALPDNDDFGSILTRMVKMDKLQLKGLGQRARAYVEELTDVYGQKEKMPRFGWDRVAATCANVLRNCEIKDRNTTWLKPKLDLIAPEPISEAAASTMNNTDFVRYVICNMWKRPDLARSFFANEIIKSLNCGFRLDNMQRVPFDRNAFLGMIKSLVDSTNHWEKQRMGVVVASTQDLKYGVV